MRFFDVLTQTIGLLVFKRRISYRALKLQFDLDDASLAALKEELVDIHQLATDWQGTSLVWTGDPASTPTSVPSRPVQQPISTRDDSDQSAPVPAVTYPIDAERRQLTVMFCDVVGSTDLSARLDPEDLCSVIRAYQEIAAHVIQQYDGHIAQYLGDGLLTYFGWPRAHEDDALRSVHAGLGIIEAMATLNRRLKADHDVQLAVRLGIHTGPVVVGEMGGGTFNGYYMTLLAEAHHKVGRTTEGLDLLTEALALMDEIDERLFEASTHLLQGELLLTLPAEHHQEAETRFRQAIDVARSQQAKSWELRAATSLARLWQQQDKRQDAHDLLAPVYNWFTEGFDTVDLQGAKALLDELM